jgi:hypothetical protein
MVDATSFAPSPACYCYFREMTWFKNYIFLSTATLKISGQPTSQPQYMPGTNVRL